MKQRKTILGLALKNSNLDEIVRRITMLDIDAYIVEALVCGVYTNVVLTKDCVNAIKNYYNDKENIVLLSHSFDVKRQHVTMKYSWTCYRKENSNDRYDYKRSKSDDYCVASIADNVITFKINELAEYIIDSTIV